MNMNRLINMAIKAAMALFMKKGIDAAINMTSRMGGGAKADDPSLSPEERAALQRKNDQKAKDLGKRMQQIQKITRRMR